MFWCSRNSPHLFVCGDLQMHERPQHKKKAVDPPERDPIRTMAWLHVPGSNRSKMQRWRKRRGGGVLCMVVGSSLPFSSFSSSSIPSSGLNSSGLWLSLSLSSSQLYLNSCSLPLTSFCSHMHWRTLLCIPETGITIPHGKLILCVFLQCFLYDCSGAQWHSEGRMSIVQEHFWKLYFESSTAIYCVHTQKTKPHYHYPLCYFEEIIFIEVEVPHKVI